MKQPAHASGSSTFGAVSWILFLVASLCLIQGLSKLLVFSVGARAHGTVVEQERTISTRGAYWLRYEFDCADGTRYHGTAMTAATNAKYTSLTVAYLSFAPQWNIPAYGSYITLLVVTWIALGLLLFGLAFLLRRKSS